MASRIGLGPVFTYDWLTSSRRWQIYATRAFFITSLLVALSVVWLGAQNGSAASVRTQASVGQEFFYAIVGTQLALILLAAPAATAGALCVDKARGTLAHILITDLSDAEIVLGKLASRLIPVLGFVLCPIPVLALTTLMGGIDPVALAGAFLMTIGLALFACSLALLLSVWGSKTYEVLMATYGILGAWLLFGPMWEGISWNLIGLSRPAWLYSLDPFALAFAPYWSPASFWLPTQIVFMLVLTALAAAMVLVAVRKTRPVAVRQFGQRSAESRGRLRIPGVAKQWAESTRERLASLGFRTFFHPSLDSNPVLWREWHRNQPSRWLKIVRGVFVTLTVAFTMLAIFANVTSAPGRGSEFGALVVAFSVSIGLLLVSIGAPTSLAEERTRGSLDVLMATPLTTPSIVWGKWLGAYRTVPSLALCPVVMTFIFVSKRPELALIPIVLLVLILAQGALTTSVGLLLATWIPRMGRALAISVGIHLLLTVGFVMILMALNLPDRFEFYLAMFSPFWGPGLLTVTLEQSGPRGDEAQRIIIGAIVYSHIAIALSALLFWVTVRSFDRRLGRISSAESVEARTGGKSVRLKHAFAAE